MNHEGPYMGREVFILASLQNVSTMSSTFYLNGYQNSGGH